MSSGHDSAGGGAPRSFGRYQVLERLGAGAMGAVYRARDASLGRDVAVKTIHVLGASGFQAEMFRARFDNEARAVAALDHDHVVQVFDVGIEGDTPFLVMELVEGGSLAERIKAGRFLDAGEAMALGQQIGSALAAAHAAGIVHRDVKPGNILETRPGKWKLADFGIAHVPDSPLTITGQFLGSPAYAAPEAIGRGDIGPAADVYGLGATLHAGLSGQPPYGPDGVLSAGALSGDEQPSAILALDPPAPAPLVAAVSAAVDRDPARRPSAAAFVGLVSGNVLDSGPGRAHGPPAAAVVPMAGLPPGGAPGRQPSQRTIALAGIAIVTLIAGIAIGVGLSGDGDGQAADSAAPAGKLEDGFGRGQDGTRSLERGGPPSERGLGPQDRGHERRPLSRKDAEKIERDWRKVEHKLDKGELEDAVEHLAKILRRDPGDGQARELYQQLTGRDWSGERDRQRWNDD